MNLLAANSALSNKSFAVTAIFVATARHEKKKKKNSGEIGDKWAKYKLVM